MGTSKARRNSGSEGWKDTAKKVARENARDAVDIGIKTGLAVLPNGPTKAPIYTATREVYKFAKSVKKHGWSEGAKRYAIGEAGSETGKRVGRAIWNNATGGGVPAGVDPTASQAMQTAFITTCGKIAEKGAKAI